MKSNLTGQLQRGVSVGLVLFGAIAPVVFKIEHWPFYRYHMYTAPPRDRTYYVTAEVLEEEGGDINKAYSSRVLPLLGGDEELFVWLARNPSEQSMRSLLSLAYPRLIQGTIKKYALWRIEIYDREENKIGARKTAIFEMKAD